MRPNNLRYTEEHEWVLVEGETATVGITHYATEELGEIVFVELPNVNDEFEQMDEFGSVESVKTVSNLYLPISGRVSAINETIQSSPETVSESPYSDGWLVKVDITDLNELDDLMTAEEYQGHLENLS